MPCCTYLIDRDKNMPIQNRAVAEWLANARKATGVELVIIEIRNEVTRWFKTRVIWRYEILWPLGDGSEYQCINFYRDGTDWTINLYVPAEMAVAYLMGLCANHKP